MTPARPEALARVAARIREEAESLAQVVGALEDSLGRYRSGAQETLVVHWVGGLVHDFYTGLEKVFCEVSPDLNGLVVEREQWHRDLLHAMTLDLPGFRPPVVRAQVEAKLVDLLKFRHVYRNLYSFRLHWDRVRELGEMVLSLWPEVRGDLAAFAAALDAMARV